MRNRLAAFIFGMCVCAMSATCVFAAEFTDTPVEEMTEDVFSDGDLSGIASEAKKIAEEKAQKYEEEQTEARMTMAEKKAEEAHRNVQEMIRKQKEEEARAAAEAARAAEEARVAHRREIVDFALQFEGNPYVYGGTSLTNGADCSGFVMSVFKEFGYELPRVAAAQYESSVKKNISEIEVGDLVFYGSGGIGHVALYIGDGKIIHASTSATGIKISDYDYETPAGIGTYLK